MVRFLQRLAFEAYWRLSTRQTYLDYSGWGGEGWTGKRMQVSPVRRDS